MSRMMEAAAELRTARLRLRPLEEDDEPALHRQWNTPEVGRYLFDGQPVPVEAVREQIERSRRCFDGRGYGLFALALLDDPGRLIGFAGLRPFGEPERVELLYALLPGFWGRGLATEAARAVLAFGFAAAGLEEIWAAADRPNAASLRVMERLGMRFVEQAEPDGRPTLYYRLGRTELREA